MKESFSIGHGYDVHRLVEGRKLILGGVEIEHHLGLLGHSDADVALHAVCDAILGALGLGDIGTHFPDSDEKYQGIDSRELLRQVAEQMHAAHYALNNLDLTIVAQAPKIAPHIDAMKQNIARDLDCKVDHVNVKATTTEGLGFVGREEGIESHAVAILVRSNER